MSARPSVLVLTYTDFRSEPRALKQVMFLRDRYEVTTAGFGPAPFADVPHIEIPQVPTLRWGIVGRLLSAGFLVLHWYRPIQWLNALDRESRALFGTGRWDAVIAHDLKTIDAAFALEPREGVIVDLHEYAPRQEEQDRLWRLLVAPYFRWQCATRVAKADAVVTVGQGISEEYAREFGFTSAVVTNATPFEDLEPTPVGTPIRLVHSGSAAAQRRLDILINAVVQSSADVTLDLYLVGDQPVVDGLKALAGDDPRIRFREPVAYRDLIRTLNGYDVGVHLLPPHNFNHRWALPNKFFDYVQARLGVVIGPSPEMARIITEHGFGEVLEDFEPPTLAATLERLSAERVALWKAASAASAAALSSESQGEVWRDIVADVVGS